MYKMYNCFESETNWHEKWWFWPLNRLLLKLWIKSWITVLFLNLNSSFASHFGKRRKGDDLQFPCLVLRTLCMIWIAEIRDGEVIISLFLGFSGSWFEFEIIQLQYWNWPKLDQSGPPKGLKGGPKTLFSNFLQHLMIFLRPTLLAWNYKRIWLFKLLNISCDLTVFTAAHQEGESLALLTVLTKLLFW